VLAWHLPNIRLTTQQWPDVPWDLDEEYIEMLLCQSGEENTDAADWLRARYGSSRCLRKHAFQFHLSRLTLALWHTELAKAFPGSSSAFPSLERRPRYLPRTVRSKLWPHVLEHARLICADEG